LVRIQEKISQEGFEKDLFREAEKEISMMLEQSLIPVWKSSSHGKEACKALNIEDFSDYNPLKKSSSYFKIEIDA